MVKTHCPLGHAYDVITTSHRGTQRRCRACTNMNQNRRNSPANASELIASARELSVDGVEYPRNTIGYWMLRNEHTERELDQARVRIAELEAVVRVVREANLRDI